MRHAKQYILQDFSRAVKVEITDPIALSVKRWAAPILRRGRGIRQQRAAAVVG